MIETLNTNYETDLNFIFEDTLKTFQDAPWENKNFYANWLAQTYFMVSQTPRFICLAAARFSVDEDDYHRRMVDHFSDEDKHEYVILKDLENLGFSINDFSKTPETSLIIEQLYHQIDRVDPIAIFGRILFLEMLTASLNQDFKVFFKDLYDKETGEFLMIHFEEDVEHVKKAMKSISDLPDKKQSIVGDEFYMTGYLYKEFFKGVLSQSA